jgi:hypothetical protein
MAMKKVLIPLFVLAVLLVVLSLPGCSKRSGTDEEAAADAEQPTEETETEAKPAPPPRMNEDVYIQIKARSALIYEKYKDEPEQAQKEVETVYAKFGVTNDEYKTFVSKLPPLRAAELEKRVMDYMQKVAPEYK